MLKSPEAKACWNNNKSSSNKNRKPSNNSISSNNNNIEQQKPYWKVVHGLIQSFPRLSQRSLQLQRISWCSSHTWMPMRQEPSSECIPHFWSEGSMVGFLFFTIDLFVFARFIYMMFICLLPVPTLKCFWDVSEDMCRSFVEASQPFHFNILHIGGFNRDCYRCSCRVLSESSYPLMTTTDLMTELLQATCSF